MNQASSSKRARSAAVIPQAARSIFQRLRPTLGWVAVAVIASGCTLQDWVGNNPTSFQLSNVVDLINSVIGYLAAFSALVTIFIMIAGYQALMSAGSEESTTRAKDTIKYAAFGMVFLVFGYAIVRLIFATFAYGTNPFDEQAPAQTQTQTPTPTPAPAPTPTPTPAPKKP